MSENNSEVRVVKDFYKKRGNETLHIIYKSNIPSDEGIKSCANAIKKIVLENMKKVAN